MSESRQDPAMRREHMTRALTALRQANTELGNARDWLFDLDYMPLRPDLIEVKAAIQVLTTRLARLRDGEFPHGG